MKKLTKQDAFFDSFCGINIGPKTISCWILGTGYQTIPVPLIRDDLKKSCKHMKVHTVNPNLIRNIAAKKNKCHYIHLHLSGVSEAVKKISFQKKLSLEDAVKFLERPYITIPVSPFGRLLNIIPSLPAVIEEARTKDHERRGILYLILIKYPAKQQTRSLIYGSQCCATVPLTHISGSALRIPDMLVWIRIRGSVHLTDLALDPDTKSGSNSGPSSGSCYFQQGPSRWQLKICFF
jgi:hypothetical protein